MEPITREEYYLAKIAGTYKGKTPEPVTIEEYYLATMAGDYSGNTPQPVTRMQYYMAKVAGVWGGSIPAPVTRLEYYWAAIANGEGTVFPPVTREEHFLVLVADAYSVVLTVVTGNPALLENSKGNRGLESLTLHGKSTQESTTGANLLPCSEKEVVTTLKKYKFKNPLPAGGYRVSIKSANRVPVGATFQCAMEGVDGNSVYRNMSHETKSVIMIATNVVVSFAIYSDTAYNESNGKTTIFTGLMINAGDATIPYEPYTGGKPSPSPEYPQEIESTGDVGEIALNVLGKNLIPFKEIPTLTEKGITITTKSNGIVHFKGTATTAYDSPTISLQGVCLPSGRYRAFPTINSIRFHVVIKKRTGDRLWQNNIVIIEDGDEPLYCYFTIDDGASVDNDAYVYMQMDNGEMLSESDFEPYKPAQTLIIPTPNGLPGIPVSSGGNYTDEKGQQWVADEIDLAKGERVQRIGEYGFTGAEVWNSWGVNKYTEGITGFYWYFKNTLSTVQKRILNTHAVFSDNAWGGREEGTVAVVDLNDKYITWSVRNEYLEDISDNNVAIESFKKMLGEINAKMLYCLAEPIRTPLPPETIAAYKAMRTYSPTTTVTNDAEAGMSVGYAKMK